MIDPKTGLVRIDEVTPEVADKVVVNLVIIGDIKVARRCAEMFDLDYDAVIEQYAEEITFARLKVK